LANVRQIAETLKTDVSINYKSDFELVLMRWRYLLKSPNPPPEVFQEFNKAITNVSRKMWYNFRYAFSTVGYDQNDVQALAKIYLVGYLGIFSLKNEENLKKFVEAFKKKNGLAPTAEEIAKKDQNNFVSFLTQRLEEAGKVCSQKNRNIRGTDGFKEAYIGDFVVDVSDELLAAQPEVYGYRKLKKKELEALSAAAGVKAKGSFQTAASKVVRVVELGPKTLRAEDLSELYDPENAYTLNPLLSMEIVEQEHEDLNLRKRFEGLSLEDRSETLKTFIASYKDNPRYSEEIKAAKQLVRRLG